MDTCYRTYKGRQRGSGNQVEGKHVYQDTRGIRTGQCIDTRKAPSNPQFSDRTGDGPRQDNKLGVDGVIDVGPGLCSSFLVSLSRAQRHRASNTDLRRRALHRRRLCFPHVAPKAACLCVYPTAPRTQAAITCTSACLLSAALSTRKKRCDWAPFFSSSPLRLSGKN